MIHRLCRCFAQLSSRARRLNINVLLLWSMGLVAFAGLGVRCTGGADPGPPPKGVQRLGQFRTIVEEGGIPGDNTLDARDYFADHELALPAGLCGEAVCPQAMLSIDQDWVRGAYQLALHLGFSASTDATPVARIPLDLVVVVETSGSMGSHLGPLRRGLRELSDRLGSDDRIGIVTYDDAVATVVDLDDLSSPAELDQLVASLQTRAVPIAKLTAGLETGFLMAQQAFEPGRQRRVVLVTDAAQPDEGKTPQEVLDLADEYVGDGISLSTVGLGVSFDADLLRRLAERGGGSFHFQQHGDGLDEVFRTELDYVAVPVAYDVELEATPGPGYRFGEALGAPSWQQDDVVGRLVYPVLFRTNRPGQPLRPGGEIGVMLRMIPTGAVVSVDDGHRVADVSLSYLPAESASIVEQQLSVRNPLAPGEYHTPFTSNPEMDLRHASLNLYYGLREASRFAHVDHASALWTLEQLRAEAVWWQSAHPQESIAPDLLLIDLFIANLRDRSVPARNPSERLPEYYYEDDGDLEFWYLFDPLTDIWWDADWGTGDDWEDDWIDDDWTDEDPWVEDDYWDDDDYDWSYDDGEGAGCDTGDDDEYYDDGAGCDAGDDYDDSSGCDSGDDDYYYDDDYDDDDYYYDDSSGCDSGDDDYYDDSSGCDSGDDDYYDDSSGCDSGDDDWGDDGWDDSGEGCSVHGRPVDLASLAYLLLLIGFMLIRRRR